MQRKPSVRIWSEKYARIPVLYSREVQKQVRGLNEREILMLVPENSDGFRATVGTLQSLDVVEGMNFHSSSFPEDRCVSLLKKLGKPIPRFGNI
jgi:hypothetical protein